MVMLCWYGIVYFIGGCASPNHARWRAIQTRVLADAKQIERKKLTQEELNEAVAGLKLKWLMTEFEPTISFQSMTNWAVRLEPRPAEPYNAPPLWRLSFLDFSRAHFRTVVVGANENAQTAH